MGDYVIYKKACDRLKILRMLKYEVDRNVLINIYLSFIRPILGNVIGENCTQNEANLLESVQVEAGRIITGLRVNSSRSKLYSELGWEPLYTTNIVWMLTTGVSCALGAAVYYICGIDDHHCLKFLFII